MSVSALFTASLNDRGRVAISGVAPGEALFPRTDPRNGSYVREPMEIKDLDGVVDVSSSADGLAIMDKDHKVRLFGIIGSSRGPFSFVNIGD